MSVANERAFLHMRWADVCFVHWRVDAESLQRTLPPGLEIDHFEGSAWLSIVPFSMPHVRVGFAPAFPGFSNVLELNLRTYVRAGDVVGVWFYSLDAASPLLVRSARMTTGLPYFDARIESSERDSSIEYSSERRGSRARRFVARYQPGSVEATATIGSLDSFLHERYAFYSRRNSRLICGRVRHAPWSFAETEIAIESNTLTEDLGIDLGARPDRCTFSRGVDVDALVARNV